MTASDLTPRDRAVLEQLLAGRTAKQIAGEAGYPQNTLSYRLHRLKKRIGLRSIIQLGAWCEQQGIKGKPLPLARDRGCAARGHTECGRLEGAVYYKCRRAQYTAERPRR